MFVMLHQLGSILLRIFIFHIIILTENFLLVSCKRNGTIWLLARQKASVPMPGVILTQARRNSFISKVAYTAAAGKVLNLRNNCEL